MSTEHPVAERIDQMIAGASPGAVVVLSYAEWFALKNERAPRVDDRGARGLMFRGRQVYVGGDTRMMGAAEAAEWGIKG